MYSQNYSVVDNVLYPMQPQQMSSQHYQQKLQSPLHPSLMQPEEPLPSATNDKPNVALSTSQLAEFSSTMVYLMWHARRQSVMELHSNSKTNHHISQSNTSLEQTKVTADMANMTSTAFKKFCKQILSATQLSESVILLSLKYIAMLLQNSPNIQGADGSEYRLFTVALMLANKFLDDNTFTNKTWSEVSGMKVIDLNIMELEFLDVLRFRLSVKKEEYERWRTALYNFRSQLMNVPAEIQRQKLMETMALSVGSTPQQQQQQQWPTYNNNSQYIKQQQHHHQPLPLQHQQQQHAAAVAHSFFLFKSQQQYPVQPTFNGPLTRVPLRIPTQPVYHNRSSTSTMNQERRQTSINTTAKTTSGTTIEPVYTPYHHPTSNQPLPPPPQSMTQQQHLPPPSCRNPVTAKVTTPYSQASPFNQSQQSSYSNNRGYPTTPMSQLSVNTPSATPSTRVSRRTSSLPQVNGIDLSVKNSSYYYTPPSSAPTNGYNRYSTTTTPTTTSNTSTTSYYIDPNSNTPTVMSTGKSDYNPYSNSSTNPITNDVYNRPMIPRSTSYKNPVTPKGHDFSTPKAVYNGPTLEDPLTAAESYRPRR